MEDVATTNYDLTPFWRSTVGFDRLPVLIELAATEGMPAGQPSRLHEVIDA
jgi:hypothetical protein